jgi:secreted trypsin-like serine protease
LFFEGWGKVENGKKSNVLMKAYVPYITNKECAEKFASHRIEVQETYLCAGGKTKTDTCSGDSGELKLKNY